MKQLHIGSALLAVLLGMSLWLGAKLEKIHHAPAELLDQAARCAAEENWEESGRLYAEALRLWKQHRNFTAAMTRHDAMEQVEGDFAELAVYLGCREGEEFSALCARLTLQLRTLENDHTLSLWNLL